MPDYRFVSPYLPLGAPQRWLRGNHHGHSLRSDGQDTPEANIAAYEAAGYDFIALSEHDLFCDPAEHQPNTTMLLLPAVEITSDLEQTLMYLGADGDLPVKEALSLAGVQNFVMERGGLFIVDHPNWHYRPNRLHAPVEELLQIRDVGAIEIYTGVIERLPGASHAVDVWDRLLSAGQRIWGHATDDQHDAVDRFLGWNMVQHDPAQPINSSNVITALREGRFVASTGQRIERIGVTQDGRAIEVESDAQELRWVTRDGIVAAVASGGTGRLAIEELLALPNIVATARWRDWSTPADLRYVRLECRGPAGRTAWSQPFFIVAG